MTPHVCKDCGGPHQGGRGRRLCNDCRAKKHDPDIAAKRRADKELAEAAAEGQKWCPRCRNYLPLAQFGVRDRSNKPRAYCIPCQKAYLHEHRIKKLYGIDSEEYDRILEMQKGRCAICRNKPRTSVLAVDHDHITGEVRGLLCSRCNHKLLGAAHEREDILRRAARYLEAPPVQVGGTDHLGPDEAFVEALARLEELHQDCAGEVAAVLYAPDGDELPPAPDWPVLLRLEDFTTLVRAAGYGDPEPAA